MMWSKEVETLLNVLGMKCQEAWQSAEKTTGEGSTYWEGRAIAYRDARALVREAVAKERRA